MRSFIFLFRDRYGNNAYFQVETGSHGAAWDAFIKEHGGDCYAVIEDSNMEILEFTA